MHKHKIGRYCLVKGVTYLSNVGPDSMVERQDVPLADATGPFDFNRYLYAKQQISLPKFVTEKCNLKS